MKRFEQIAYRRFIWNAPKEAGDIERCLTLTGLSVPYPSLGKVLPASAVVGSEPWKPVTLTPFGKKKQVVLYPDEFIEVAPAKILLTEVSALLGEIDKSMLGQTILARVNKVIKTTTTSTTDATNIVNQILSGVLPVIPLTSALDPTDIISLGDGDTHATSLRDMTNVCLSIFSQSLGVHYGDTYKKERLVTEEVEACFDAVEIIRKSELAEREKLATIMNWEVYEA